MKPSRLNPSFTMKQSLLWIFLILMGFIQCSRCTIVDSSDAEESHEVWTALRGEFGTDFLLGSSPRPRSTAVTVYGILDKTNQDEFVEFLFEKSSENNWKPIHLKFKVEQVWNRTELEDGGYVKRRGVEKVLRGELIDP